MKALIDTRTLQHGSDAAWEAVVKAVDALLTLDVAINGETTFLYQGWQWCDPRTGDAIIVSLRTDVGEN